MIKRRRIRALFAVLAFLPLSAQPASQDKPAAFTLNECIIQAVKRNLGVAVQV